MKRYLTALFLATSSNTLFAMGADDPIITGVMIDQLEVRDTKSENTQAWDVQAWIGKDLQKIYFKTEGERVGGDTESSEIRVLYSHAIAPYWEVTAGIKTDLDPNPKRNWLEFGVQGLAPYFFEVDASFFVGESGRTGARFKTEYEWMLTQKWVLSPEIEINLYGHNDDDMGVGSGLSRIEAGLRLRYEIKREFAPYIGINWEKAYGKTADYHREAGEDISDTQFVMGVRAWF